MLHCLTGTSGAHRMAGAPATRFTSRSLNACQLCRSQTQELANDPLGILRPASKLQHQLPLASAYSAVAACPDADHGSQVRSSRCAAAHITQ